jgi:hypothetical protein
VRWKLSLGRQTIVKRIGIILGGGILSAITLFGWWVFSCAEHGTTGSVSEVFDAEAPSTPRGCMAQAWSVAEVLRCRVNTA